MKNQMSLVWRFATVVLSLSFVSTTWAIPIVQLEAPIDINVGEDFSVSVFARGVTDVDPILGPDELVAFGFNVGYQHTGYSYLGYTIAPPFNDDTPLLGGPFAGSVFPGIQGDKILLATIDFQALQAGFYKMNVGVQGNRPDITGLFTLLYPNIPFTSYADFTIHDVPAVPEPSSLLLLAIGIITCCVSRRLGHRCLNRIN